MEVIPAVDIKGGRCVRLLQGDFDKETVYADDPLQMAQHWESLGARRLHVVDLDGAKAGTPQNTDVMTRIVRSVRIPVQLGGGIRSLDTAVRMVDLGVDRVVVGTSAALDRDLAEAMFDSLGERVVLGLDAREGFLAIHGWRQVLPRKAVDYAREMEALGARRIVHTDVGRDGMLAGVNLESMRQIAEAVQIPVIASGGVTGIEDIRRLKELESLGIEGIITGKAIYVGSVDLREAIGVAES